MDNPILFLTILLPPFLGALVIGLTGRYLPRKLPGILGCATVLVSLAASIRGFVDLHHVEGALLEADFGVWFAVAPLTVRFHFLLDPLASFMTLVVSGVGFLIHVYSIGYMRHEARDERFFSFMNLFTGTMLTLVLAGNLPLMFIGWEGVGLCSYLLIGYWFTDGAKAAAGIKAFLVNRIGDLGFLIGIFLLVHAIGTVDFQALAQPALFESVGAGLLCGIGLCLFLGATGKSAQIPLYMWLPDAMAGPTPVSALIHAATMVTAGVYMVGRLGVLFAASGVLPIVAVVGAATAFFAATMALTERDLKKVLAYSTVSQLGFMFLAMGCGAYSAGIFHVYTHAFFKALLFLAAGSVIHALHGEQDIRRMGGLLRKLPVTGTTFLIGGLALAGLPLLSGYLSKDEILLAARTSFVPLWLLAELTALLTAAYVGRLVWLVFFGKTRIEAAAWAGVRESPPVMTGPLVVLAAGAALAGYVNLPHVVAHEGAALLKRFLAIAGEQAITASAAAEVAGLVVSGLVCFGGLALAYGFVVRRRAQLHARLARPGALGRLHALLLAKYFVDGFCMRYLAGGARKLAGVVHFLDELFVDAFLVRGVFGLLVRILGEATRLLQAGRVQAYGMALVLGGAAMLLYLLLSEIPW
ncbi:MAG: NADH-quinone oxidoreductase subunit L [Planctomycetes bacterium]|nr:NADH-quinone oxidoreductase subunit L [Planctomycetota bacterium]